MEIKKEKDIVKEVKNEKKLPEEVIKTLREGSPFDPIVFKIKNRKNK